MKISKESERIEFKKTTSQTKEYHKTLTGCREEIDRIDGQILNLFAQRMTVCGKIAAIKKEKGLPITDRKREREKIDTLLAQSPEMIKDAVPRLFETIMNLSKDFQHHCLNETGTKRTKLLVINGPNINLLGIREPEIYGHRSYTDLLDFITKTACEENLEINCFQSNHEGDLIDQIQDARQKYDGIIINPGGFTHTGIALMDALKAVGLPAVEVHLSDIQNRESFRQQSYIEKACLKTFSGMGFEGYRQGLLFLKKILTDSDKT